MNVPAYCVEPVILSDVDTVVREADFLSLHCPLSDGTRHIIGAEALWTPRLCWECQYVRKS